MPKQTLELQGQRLTEPSRLRRLQRRKLKLQKRKLVLQRRVPLLPRRLRKQPSKPPKVRKLRLALPEPMQRQRKVPSRPPRTMQPKQKLRKPLPVLQRKTKQRGRLKRKRERQQMLWLLNVGQEMLKTPRNWIITDTTWHRARRQRESRLKQKPRRLLLKLKPLMRNLPQQRRPKSKLKRRRRLHRPKQMPQHMPQPPPRLRLRVPHEQLLVPVPTLEKLLTMLPRRPRPRPVMLLLLQPLQQKDSTPPKSWLPKKPGNEN